MNEKIKKKLARLPSTPGVYLFKDEKGEVLYVGKAGSIKRRVSSYFSAKKGSKADTISRETRKIGVKKMDTVIEALIEEARLIKKLIPKYNVKEKDDRSFLYLVITDEEYPRILLKRGKDLGKEKIRSTFGPFVFSSEIRGALKVVRKIFPYSTHKKEEIKKGKECFYYQIGLCPGTCAGVISRKEYLKEVRNIELFFKGRKKKILEELKKEMKEKSKKEEFEKAAELKRKIELLSHIRDIAVMGKEREKGGVRIEGYDISTISGRLGVGAMVVFEGEAPKKEDYRKFKIRNIREAGDTQMLKEVMQRRVKRDWRLPHLILVDGGRGQVSAIEEVLEEEGLSIPVVGIAKGRERKGERVVGKIPRGIKKETLLKVQSEAHRFALSYHRHLRKEEFLR